MSSTVGASVSFFAVVGKTELHSTDDVCSVFEVEELDTMEKVLVKSFAGIEKRLVLS